MGANAVWRPEWSGAASDSFSEKKRQIPDRTRPDVQPVHPRLDHLLRSLLQDQLSPTLKRIDAYVIRWHVASSSGYAGPPRGASYRVCFVDRAPPTPEGRRSPRQRTGEKEIGDIGGSQSAA